MGYLPFCRFSAQPRVEIILQRGRMVMVSRATISSPKMNGISDHSVKEEEVKRSEITGRSGHSWSDGYCQTWTNHHHHVCVPVRAAIFNLGHLVSKLLKPYFGIGPRWLLRGFVFRQMLPRSRGCCQQDTLARFVEWWQDLYGQKRNRWYDWMWLANEFGPLRILPV